MGWWGGPDLNDSYRLTTGRSKLLDRWGGEKESVGGKLSEHVTILHPERTEMRCKGKNRSLSQNLVRRIRNRALGGSAKRAVEVHEYAVAFFNPTKGGKVLRGTLQGLKGRMWGTHRTQASNGQLRRGTPTNRSHQKSRGTSKD